MITMRTVTSIAGVAEAEIVRWVEHAWLRPDGREGAWVFREVDVARVRLIAELRDLRLDDEAMPVVLSLLDQLHATRRQLRMLVQAVEESGGEAVRARMLDLLKEAGAQETQSIDR